MCRFIAFLGKPILTGDLLYKPKNSLIAQSQAAQESFVTVNGDGFGLGWYNRDVSGDPAVFRSIQPAWNDLNLLHITSIIKSGCFFGHVRAASTGGVSQFNCHPFHYKQFLFMQNGTLTNFDNIKRRIRANLSDEAYDWIKGQTDTEHLFALFIDHIRKQPMDDPIKVYVSGLEKVMNIIDDLQQTYNNNSVSFMNLVIADGERMVATRYVSHPSEQARTLHYSVGSAYEFKDDQCHIIPSEPNKNQVAVVASEILTNSKATWHNVKQNHFLIIDKDLSAKTQTIKTV